MDNQRWKISAWRSFKRCRERRLE